MFRKAKDGAAKLDLSLSTLEYTVLNICKGSSRAF